MLNKINIVPEVTYENADVLRLVILKDNRKRAGIYRWVNKLNGKSYVGSSLDLARRLNYYYNLSFLAGYAANKKKRKINSIIYRSLLKYGYSNFKLEIIEYCDTLNVIQREQYYIDLIKPEYNILEIAGSLRGFKHSESTKELLRKYSLENKTWVVNFAEATGESTNVVNRCTGETHNFNSNLKAAEFIGKAASTLYVIIKRKNFYLNKEYLVYKSSTPFEEIVNSDAYKEAVFLLNDTESSSSLKIEKVPKYYRHTLAAKEAISKNNKKSKAVVLTNIKTNETLKFNTMKEAASF